MKRHTRTGCSRPRGSGGRAGRVRGGQAGGRQAGRRAEPAIRVVVEVRWGTPGYAAGAAPELYVALTHSWVS